MSEFEGYEPPDGDFIAFELAVKAALLGSEFEGEGFEDVEQLDLPRGGRGVAVTGIPNFNTAERLCSFLAEQVDEENEWTLKGGMRDPREGARPGTYMVVFTKR